MDKSKMTVGMRVRYTLSGCDATYQGAEPDGTPSGSDVWAYIFRDDGVTGIGPNGEYAVMYTDLAPISNLGSTTAATAPKPVPVGQVWAKNPPPAVTTVSVWHHPFQIGDRVYIEDECEGTILGFQFGRKMIDVARDDDGDGSGCDYTSLKDGKQHTAWSCSMEEITLLTSGTKVPGEGMAVPEPSSHKMGLDPETIDWSKFKKIRDML